MHRHREPNNHACSTPDLPSATRKKNEAAQALLAKHFPPTARTSSSSTPAVRPTKQPTNPKKAAQLRQVQLMKMRHRAQPADPRDKDKPVPLEQKLFVLVRTETSSEDIPFWFRKVGPAEGEFFSAHEETIDHYCRKGLGPLICTAKNLWDAYICESALVFTEITQLSQIRASPFGC